MLYHVGEQGGGAWTDRLERPITWPGPPPRTSEATTLLVTPGPDLTWSHWSSVLAGSWTLSIKHKSFDFDAQIEWKNDPTHSLGTISFKTYRSS